MIAICDDGHEINYEDEGQGTPVLFVHGFPLDHALWSQQLDGLASRARCIAPDLRGFGASGREGPFSMDQYADDLVCLLDHLEVPRAVVAGLSMGGYVAFALWRSYPERVRALVLADTRATADDEAALAKRREMIEAARASGPQVVGERMLEGMVGRTSRQRSPEVVLEVRRIMERAPLEGVVGAIEAMMARPDSTPDLARIDVPTLIIVGDEDVITPPAQSRAMHELIPGSRLEILEGAGHASNMERPAAFNHLLGEFLAQLELD